MSTSLDPPATYTYRRVFEVEFGPECYERKMLVAVSGGAEEAVVLARLVARAVWRTSVGVVLGVRLVDSYVYFPVEPAP